MLPAVLVFNVIRQNIPNTQRHFWFTALHLRILLNKFGPVYRRVGRAQNRAFPRRGRNENVKKKKSHRFNKQNNNFARASRFFHMSLSFFHDYDMKKPNLTFYGDPNKRRRNFISLSELGYGS